MAILVHVVIWLWRREYKYDRHIHGAWSHTAGVLTRHRPTSVLICFSSDIWLRVLLCINFFNRPQKFCNSNTCQVGYISHKSADCYFTVNSLIIIVIHFKQNQMQTVLDTSQDYNVHCKCIHANNALVTYIFTIYNRKVGLERILDRNMLNVHYTFRYNIGLHL